MEDLNDKILGGNLPAPEWNQVPSELQNVIEALGQTLTNLDLDQLGKAIAGYVANSTFYTDSGSANTYVLSVVGTKQRAPSYTNGFHARFVPAATNTAASTVNVAGLGVINIKKSDGTSDIIAGEIVAGEELVLSHRLTPAAHFVIVKTDLSSKADIDAPTFTGIPKADTAAPGTSTTQLATTEFATLADNLKANKNNAALTGIPTAPTAAPATSSAQVATTAFATAAGLLVAIIEVPPAPPPAPEAAVPAPCPSAPPPPPPAPVPSNSIDLVFAVGL